MGSPSPNSLFAAIAECAPSLSAHQLRLLLALAAAGGRLHVPTREIRRRTGLTAGGLARAASGLEASGHLCIRRGLRSQASAYEPGPALAILAEHVPCSTQMEHSYTDQPVNSGNVLHPDGASLVEKCSTAMEQETIPCSTQMEQEPLANARHPEQAQLHAVAQVAADFFEAAEQDIRARAHGLIDSKNDRTIDRSIYAHLQNNAEAARAAVHRVVSISNGKRFAADELTQARGWLLGYMAANPPVSGRVPATPPDDALVRQFLSIADPGVLRSVLLELHREKRPAGENWAWFVTTCLQRVWGVHPKQLRNAREAARRKPPQNEGPPPLMAAAAAAAGVRA